MLTYLSEVKHKNAFIEVRETLSLTNGRTKTTMQAKDETIAKLQNRIKELELTIKGMTEIFGEEILEKAMKKIQVRKDTGKPVTPLEALRLLGRFRERKQADEYRKLIEANNNNNH